MKSANPVTNSSGTMEILIALRGNGYFPIVEDMINADQSIHIGFDYFGREKILPDKNRINWFVRKGNVSCQSFEEWDTCLLNEKRKRYCVQNWNLRALTAFLSPQIWNIIQFPQSWIPGKCKTEIKRNLEEIFKECITCGKRSTPHIFNFSLPDDKFAFNGAVALDPTWIKLLDRKRRSVSAFHIIDTQPFLTRSVFERRIFL